LPFDLDRAHQLYSALFGQLEPLIRDKDLLVVPSDLLSTLPLHVLVTERPGSVVPAKFDDAAWLVRKHAITVLPTVASLQSLRKFAKPSRATKPFIGFGNPLLLGPDGNDRSAHQHPGCASQSIAARLASRRIRASPSSLFRSGLADVAEVRAQPPLPETADELCTVARASGAAEDAVYLGARATEATIKRLSSTGVLAEARIVHFATHGLLASESGMLAANAEPALILTPPELPTERDDGLLTASEVAQLKLDADWVVLSACNTASAAEDGEGAEALSGLARAFFYAGARAMLVSHWAVNSEATVKLVSKSFDRLADPQRGRAEALRRSMLALVAEGGNNSHPANWAPFVVVGEGSLP
jgi:CHAT domain-containing protein